MRLTPRAVVLTTVAASMIVFAAVQDRVVAAGVGRYVELKRRALAGAGADVAIDDVLGPAVRESVRRGLLWGGGVLVAGSAVAVLMARRPVSSGERSSRRRKPGAAGPGETGR